jgi:OmpA-OmpF porin, OOP family
MRLPIFSVDSWCAAAAMAVMVLALSTGCATVRNPALERARDSYQKARQDPAIVRNAGAALDRAGQKLEAAERLWTKEHDVVEVEHLAYIVEKRVEIARVIAQRRLAADEIQPARSPRP